MSDDFSARLALPYLAAGQMQKHVTLNTALTRLDALLQTAAVSRTTTVQPGAPTDGDLYILPADAQGAAWAGRGEGSLMRFEAGGWTAVPTPPGLIAVVRDEAVVVVRDQAGWTPLGGWLGQAQGLTRLGLGTTADAANPLSAKLNSALFTALEADEGGDGDLRLTFNKQAAGDVLSLLFQSGYAARAELGLVGDDDLGLKTCDEGGVWRSVFRVDRTTGRVAFDQGAVRRETILMTGDGDYSPPAWARWIEAVCVGGGGAGGAGLAGPAGTPRFGGGGGGAGGLSQGRWAVEELDGALSVTVGAGGQGVAGGESRIAVNGVVLLRASGGLAGSTGAGGGAAGGSGGLGLRPANGGGASSITASGGAGGESLCPDGPGGGAGGGGLSAADSARTGGVGGRADGRRCARRAGLRGLRARRPIRPCPWSAEAAGAETPRPAARGRRAVQAAVSGPGRRRRRGPDGGRRGRFGRGRRGSHHGGRMSRRRHPAEPVEVLEDEAWEAPDSLSDTEWRAQSGWDGRCDPGPYDEEDGR